MGGFNFDCPFEENASGEKVLYEERGRDKETVRERGKNVELEVDFSQRTFLIIILT